MKSPHKQHRVEIYCDGSCQPNPGQMTIGVFCKNPRIEISRPLGDGTNNKAELLAVFEALRTAERLGLRNFTVFTDSKTVQLWVSGKTTLEYIPEIREMLNAMEAKLKWCDGDDNPADALSRGHKGFQRCHFDDPLENVINNPIEVLKFKDFLTLRVGGRDKYSELNLRQLKKRVPDYKKIVQEFDDGRDLAACLRWVLRGLSIDKAVRKVQIDLEVKRNAQEY